MDPLDGSGNIDVNVSIGTIFSVYRRVTEKGTPCALEDFLQPGIKQIAAGYIIYGSSTMMVYATRRGVNGFTLDPSVGEFCLSHPMIQCPPDGKIYSVNHGNFWRYNEGVRSYIHECQKKEKGSGGPYAQRYIGSMVSDVHRNLIKGGIFMYPGTVDKPKGKLRLLYECNPLAFIIEVAGGKASNGEIRVMDVQPTKLHQRSPFFIGSKNMMEELEQTKRTLTNNLKDLKKEERHALKNLDSLHQDAFNALPPTARGTVPLPRKEQEAANQRTPG